MCIHTGSPSQFPPTLQSSTSQLGSPFIDTQWDDDDAILQVLSTTEEALTTDQICARVGSSRPLRDVRVALRDLAEQGEVIRLNPDTWRGRSLSEPTQKPKTHGGKFTEDELRRARTRHGSTRKCPRCNEVGDIDTLFGWRRMRPEDSELEPQSWCLECRPLTRSDR